MYNEAELEKKIKELKNAIAKEWRKKNKEKVKEINKKYWIKRAQKELEKKEEK